MSNKPKGEIMGVGFAYHQETSQKDMHHQASIENLSALVLADLQQVNTLILARTGSDVALIPEVANHLISSGGKRLRPMLTLAMAQLAGYTGSGHIKLAASVEFMHTATLLHDDVVDESDMRRGKASARRLWGNETSVLVGDFLLGQAFKMMVEVGSLPALDVLSTAATVIAEGEVMQLAAAKNTNTTEQAYLAVIRAKTAALFAAACEVSPLLAQCSSAHVAACRNFGMNLGMAFQLIDDALDYGGTTANLGKNIGDDFREGKITLPVILAIQRGSTEEQAFWQQNLQNQTANTTGEQKTDAAFARALGLLSQHGALADTVTRAKHYGAQATTALSLFPASKIKHALQETIDFCIARVH
jgi:octaprenyl-diphosphate synthase